MILTDISTRINILVINDWNNYFDEIGLIKEEKEMIFYKNACDILKIDY